MGRVGNAWAALTGKRFTFSEQDNTGAWLAYMKQYSGFFSGEKIIPFSCDNAYSLAGNIAEIFMPIDMIADACASLTYRTVDKTTLKDVEVNNSNFQALFKQPNPYDKFADLVYKGVFNKLSDGNCYDYTKIPDSYKNPNIDLISNIWTLQPDVTELVMKRELPNPFAIKSKSDLIDYYRTFFLYKQNIDPRYIHHTTLLGIGANGKAESPLRAVEKNINNLLAVYSARFNVYDKNMNGGILSKAPSGANSSLQEAVDPIGRDAMLADLQNRNGLTGNKNFIGLSSIPLQFIKTLGTIAELQPFDETEADAVAIASIFGLDSDLVPKRSPSKFANKIDGERKLWQTVIKSMAIERGLELSKSYYLPENIIFYPDFTTVEILQEDKKTSFEADKVLIENLAALGENGQDVSANYAKIKDKYDGLMM